MRQAAWRPPWKVSHEMTVTSWSHHTPLGDYLPVEMFTPQRSPGTCGTGGDSRRTIENVGFDHSCLQMKVKVLMILPGLGAWGGNLYPVTVANGTLSLCHLLSSPAAPQAALGGHMGFPQSNQILPIQPKWVRGGEEKGEGRWEGQERFLKEEVQGRQWSTMVTIKQATEPHACKGPGAAPVLPGQERLLWVMISPAHGRHAKEVSL